MGKWSGAERLSTYPQSAGRSRRSGSRDLPADCVAWDKLAAPTVGQLRAGKLLTVEMREASQGRPFRVELSLKGFAAAHNRLRGEVAR